MKKMTRFLALAVVLGVMALGPTMTMAAPIQGASAALGHASGISILELFARLLGFQPAPSTQAPTTVSPSGAPNASTESAIWGWCRGVNC